MNAVNEDSTDQTRAAAPLTYATVKEKLGDLQFVFTQLNGIFNAGKIEIGIPAGFAPAPYKTFEATPNTAGTVSINDNNYGLSLDGRKIIIKSNVTTSDGDLTVTYNGDIVAPEKEGSYPFPIMTQSGPHGALKAIASPPTVEVVGAHGLGAMVLTKGGGAVHPDNFGSRSRESHLHLYPRRTHGKRRAG